MKGPLRSSAWLGAAAVALGLAVAPRWSRASETAPDGPHPAPDVALPRPYHPEPRVIVNVTAVKGPHRRADVERAARLGWGRIVSCYKSIDRQAKGRIELELVVAATGKVTGTRRTRSTLRNEKLAACLTQSLRGIEMPKARSSSTARAEVHVAPGDP